MRILIDTGVLWLPDAMKKLSARDEDLVLPAFAYAERVRQLERTGRALAMFDDALDAARIVVEPFGRKQGHHLSRRAGDEAVWKRLAGDAMIASHLESGDVIWTTNPKDFRELGIPDEQIVVVA